MSDFDRNIATARTGYRTDQVAIDAGLRAYMIRVYNYMTAGVALTGGRILADVSSRWWRCHPSRRRPDQRTDRLRAGHLRRSADDGLFILAPLGLVMLPKLRASTGCQPGTALTLFFCSMPACSGCCWRRSSSATPERRSRACSSSRRRRSARLSLYGYTTKRNLTRRRLVPVHGPDRHHHREPGQHLPAVEPGLNLRHFGHRRAHLCWPHRLRHAEHQRDLRR